MSMDRYCVRSNLPHLAGFFWWEYSHIVLDWTLDFGPEFCEFISGAILHLSLLFIICLEFMEIYSVYCSCDAFVDYVFYVYGLLQENMQ